MTGWTFPERQDRIQFAPRVRERIFLREKGICHLCGLKIWPGEDWEVEHRDPLWAGGSAKEEDCGVAHVKCHKVKTAAESTQRAKERRTRQKHIGAWRSKTPIPGSKRSRWKKHVDGTVSERT
jgi:5-methylcytosine-specific restriction endonuclease McrA